MAQLDVLQERRPDILHGIDAHGRVHAAPALVRVREGRHQDLVRVSVEVAQGLAKPQPRGHDLRGLQHVVVHVVLRALQGDVGVGEEVDVVLAHLHDPGDEHVVGPVLHRVVLHGQEIAEAVVAKAGHVVDAEVGADLALEVDGRGHAPQRVGDGGEGEAVAAAQAPAADGWHFVAVDARGPGSPRVGGGDVEDVVRVGGGARSDEGHSGAVLRVGGDGEVGDVVGAVVLLRVGDVGERAGLAGALVDAAAGDEHPLGAVQQQDLVVVVRALPARAALVVGRREAVEAVLLGSRHRLPEEVQVRVQLVQPVDAGDVDDARVVVHHEVGQLLAHVHRRLVRRLGGRQSNQGHRHHRRHEGRVDDVASGRRHADFGLGCVLTVTEITGGEFGGLGLGGKGQLVGCGCGWVGGCFHVPVGLGGGCGGRALAINCSPACMSPHVVTS